MKEETKKTIADAFDASAILFSELANQFGRAAEAIKEDSNPEPVPNPNPLPLNRIHGWNIAPTGFWRPSRSFQDLLFGCNKVVGDGAVFNEFGDLESGRAQTRLILDQRHTPPGEYEVEGVGPGTLKGEGTYLVPEKLPSDGNPVIAIVPLTMNGKCEIACANTKTYDETRMLNDVSVARLQNSSVLRFMDLRHINRKPASNGNHYRVETQERMLYELIPPFRAAWCCEETSSDCWWNIHHLETEDEIRANLIELKSNLAESSVVYVEHSNEVWNFRWKDGPPAATEMWAWHNQKTRMVGRIAKEVFGNRAVCVLGVQAADPQRTKLFLSNGGAEGIDAIAIAPYWGWESYFPQNFDRWIAGGVSEILGFLDEDEKKTRDWILSQRQLADEWGLRLLAYEHGSHLWPQKDNTEKRSQVWELFKETNRTPELAEQYQRRIDFWNQEINDISLWYCDVHHDFGHWEWELSEPQPRAISIQQQIQGNKV